VTAADFLATGSGGLVGFALGLLGGGGSILAVPLLIYVVGMPSVHKAIGTSALVVSANAFLNLMAHSRSGHVKWPCAIVFALSGMFGAAIGAALGQLVDGERLLFLFGLVMLAVSLAMLRPGGVQGDPNVRINPVIALRLTSIGLFVGFLSGFFGIGGGFLIVPGMILGSGMAVINAVGSSLLSVGAFGLTTAVSYLANGLIDGRVAAFFTAGGVLGGLAGVKLAGSLSQHRNLLSRIFAVMVMGVACFVLWQAAPGFFG
jgi:uncharacterized membrane protein YfcA